MGDRTIDNGWEYVAALAGGLAHEIKNPLGTIGLNLQLLEEDWADPQTPKERRTCRKLRVLQEEVRRLTQTLEDFLRFVRAEPIELRPTDLNELAREISEFVEPELARSNIEVLEQYAPDLPPCRADRRLLKQAILNIILNAQQAMADGGQLILRTSHADGHVSIEIIDTGSGIPPRLHQKVFDLFFSTRKNGSGLGLAMARRILQQHRGSVELHSEPGKGTDFRITLPAEGSDANREDP